MVKKTLSFIGYLLLVAVLGFAIRYYFLGPYTQTGDGLSSKAFFQASFADEKNVQQSMQAYQGKILVVNFWASWCPPCREEMPELSALNQQYQSKNVQVLGLAIDDVETILTFQKENPTSYPLFSAEIQGMELASSLGNSQGGLPYTVIIDANGSIIKTYLGKISKPLLEKTLSELLPKNSL
jgi:thiol-disulfide isomerase/thioredoxin